MRVLGIGCLSLVCNLAGPGISRGALPLPKRYGLRHDSARKFLAPVTTQPRSPHQLGLALINAIQAGKVSRALMLLVQGADPNATDQEGSTPLMFACSLNQPSVVRELLQRGANVAAKNSSLITPLHFVARFGHPEIVRVLLERLVDVNALDGSRVSPLQEAAYSQNEECVRALLEQGAAPDMGIPNLLNPVRKLNHAKLPALFGGPVAPANNAPFVRITGRSFRLRNTALGVALERGNSSLARLLLRYGATPTLDGQEGRSFLRLAKILATKTGDRSVLELMVQAGVRVPEPTVTEAAATGDLKDLHSALAKMGDPNSRDEIGDPAIVIAARSGFPKIVRELVVRGADPQRTGDEGKNALVAAVEAGEIDIVRMLLDLGVDPNQPMENGATAIHQAATKWFGVPDKRDRVAMVRLLLDAGALVDSKTSYGTTPLLEAMSADDLPSIQLLLERKSDPNVRFINGDSPLIAACSWRSIRKHGLKLVTTLLEHGADSSLRNPQGDTALLIAVRWDEPEAARLLLARGADPNLGNAQGDTPLKAAQSKKNATLIHLLRAAGAEH